MKFRTGLTFQCRPRYTSRNLVLRTIDLGAPYVEIAFKGNVNIKSPPSWALAII